MSVCYPLLISELISFTSTLREIQRCLLSRFSYSSYASRKGSGAGPWPSDSATCWITATSRHPSVNEKKNAQKQETKKLRKTCSREPRTPLHVRPVLSGLLRQIISSLARCFFTLPGAQCSTTQLPGTCSERHRKDSERLDTPACVVVLARFHLQSGIRHASKSALLIYA